MIKLTFDQQLEAAWNFHNIEKAVLENKIENLQIQNDRLREALKPFAYYADQIPDDVSNTASASGTVGDLRAAKAALGESDE